MDPTVIQIILQEHKVAYAITDRSLHIVALNGLLDSLGIMPEAWVGRELSELAPELIGSEDLLTDIVAGKLARFHLAWVNRERADGRTSYLTLTGLPYTRQDGGISGLVLLIEDVTGAGTIEQQLAQQRNELRLLQEQLAEHNRELADANAKLAHAVRAKDEFLATMSHELRTPLTAILGISESLQSEIYGELTEDVHHAVESIDRAGQHLLVLINDVLDIAKIEAGRLELDIGPVAVMEVCHSSLAMVAQAAQTKQIRISTTIDEAVRLIDADGRRLQQILINLLSNAVKFTPDQGAVGLDVHGDQERWAIHFSVWDTGIGIAQEDLARLFEPFVQIDNRLSRTHTGTGLGLALVRRLTDMHGGSLAVESTPGQGSRFTVSLPWHDGNVGGFPRLQREAGQTTPILPLQGDHLAPLVLVAEDNEDNALMLSAFLTSREYRAIVARTGTEALAMINDEHPDIILMDIQMPGIDGLEVIRQVRANPLTATLPIIALTALAMPGDRDRCLGVGANDYLSKPVSLKELLGLIEVQLQRSNSVVEDGA